MMAVFDELMAVNVNGHTEKKRTGGADLTYLSWPFAWAEVKKRYPDAVYEVVKFDGIPYVYDPMTGYMVYTRVTIEGITHEMWLPVMDGANKAMKSEPYSYTVRQYGKEATKTVQAATMFDVNKTIMRCLVKNLAMFGLGLYIFAGEDLPIESDEDRKAREEEQSDRDKTAEAAAGPITEAMWKSLQAEFKNAGISLKAALKEWYDFDLVKPTDISVGFLNTIISDLDKALKRK